MSRNQWKQHLRFVVPLLILYAGVASFRLGKWTFFVDESTRAYQAGLSIPNLLSNLRSDIHPPLYMFLLHFWQILFGNSDSALRAMSVLCGALHLALLSVMLAWLQVPMRVLRCTLLLLALSPCFVDYSRLAFSWPLVSFLISALLFCFVAFLMHPNRPRLLTLIGVTTLGLYTNYLTGIVALSLAIYGILANRASRKSLKYTFGWLAGTGILFLPLALLFSHQLLADSEEAVHRTLISRTGTLILRLCAIGYQFIFGDSANPANVLISVIGIAAASFLVINGIRVLARMEAEVQKPAKIYLTAAGISFIAALIAINTLHGDLHFLFTAERLQFALPPIMLVAAYGLCSLRFRALAAGVVVCLFFLLHGLYFTGYTFLNWAYHSDWSSYSKSLSAVLNRGPKPRMLVFDSPGFGRVGERYLQREMNFAEVADSTRLHLNSAKPWSSARTILWVEASRDSSRNHFVSNAREEVERQCRLVHTYEFLCDPPRWYALKEKLMRGDSSKYKIRATLYERR
jgi:hypothetical protein